MQAATQPSPASTPEVHQAHVQGRLREPKFVEDLWMSTQLESFYLKPEQEEEILSHLRLLCALGIKNFRKSRTTK